MIVCRVGEQFGHWEDVMKVVDRYSLVQSFTPYHNNLCGIATLAIFASILQIEDLVLVFARRLMEGIEFCI